MKQNEHPPKEAASLVDLGTALARALNDSMSELLKVAFLFGLKQPSLTVDIFNCN